MNWPEIPLGEIATFRNGLNYTKENEGEGLRVINVKDFGDRSLPDYDGLGELNPLGILRDEALLRHGDIIFVRSNGNKDLVGRSLFLDTPPENVSFSAFCIRARLGDAVDPRFYAYFFRTPHFRKRLALLGKGTNISNLNQEVLKRIRVPAPSRAEQSRVVAAIQPYDDLIENNRRRIELLEQAARLLYKEWFVHLRFPGHEHVTITDGVPEGWVRKSLSEIAEFRLGKMLDQKKNRGDLMPYLANVNVRWGEFDLDGLREMRFEQHELDRFGLKYGDIVMCEGGEPGRCAIWKEQIPGMMIQKAIHRIRPHQDLDHRFLYHSLLHKGKTGRLAMLFTGATIKHLPREKLAKVEIEIPPTLLTNLFLEQAGPIENQIDVLQTGIRRASEARDLLLPRLMNGEVTV